MTFTRLEELASKHSKNRRTHKGTFSHCKKFFLLLQCIYSNKRSQCRFMQLIVDCFTKRIKQYLNHGHIESLSVTKNSGRELRAGARELSQES